MGSERDSWWLETGQGRCGLPSDAVMIWWRSQRYYESSQSADILRSATRCLHAVRPIVRLNFHFPVESHPQGIATMGLLELTF